jgi:hypothetical protein
VEAYTHRRSEETLLCCGTGKERTGLRLPASVSFEYSLRVVWSSRSSIMLKETKELDEFR